MEDPVQALRDLGAPGWLIMAMVILVILTLFVNQLKKLEVFTILGRLMERLRSQERRRRSRLRRQFADHLESQIRLLNNQEEWSDSRFTELDAEVEYEGLSRSGIWRLLRRSDEVRRARSLSRALEASDERLIVLLGDPGSGKSVALRHLGMRLAKRAIKSSDAKSLLPVYVNLREWSVGPGDTIDAAAVRAFVLNSLNKVNVRDVAEFLDENFSAGLSDGTWIFLFDSFDEIPAVLSSSELDSTIQVYRDAIYEFLTTFNDCRGIVASREFRGPSTYGLATFRITALSARRRLKLIKNAGLRVEARQALLSAMPGADPAIQQLADNPMFLSLLCDHVKTGKALPQNSYLVFENYIRRRLDRDAGAIKTKFDLEVEDVRQTAGEVAFTMGMDPSLGLSPLAVSLGVAMEARGFTIGRQFTAGLSALTYTKLMRTDPNPQDPTTSHVAFAHRRFQEFFATKVVLANLDAIPPKILLKDARWRETAVTIFQTQPLASIRPLIDSVLRFLDNYLRAAKASLEEGDGGKPAWPGGLFHLLGIIDAGIINRDPMLDRIATRVDKLLSAIVAKGNLTDVKWAVDVAGAASDEYRIVLFRDAFKSSSQWLRTAAYRQLGRIRQLPSDMARSVRLTLITMALDRELSGERLRVDAQLRRLSDPESFLKCKRLLLAAPLIDAIVVFAAIAFPFVSTNFRSQFNAFAQLLLLLLVLLFSIATHETMYLLRDAVPFGATSTSVDPSEDGIHRVPLTRRFIGPWYYYALLRSGAIMITSTAFLFFYGDPGTGINLYTVILPWIIVLYAVAWPPAALFAARDGRLLSIWWWPILPALIVRTVIVSIFHFSRQFFADSGGRAARLLGVLAWILGTGLVIGLEIWIIDLIAKSEWGGYVGIAIGIVLGGIGLLAMGTTAYRAVRMRLDDRALLTQWRDDSSTVRALELKGNLDLLHNSRAKVNYVLMLRRRQALVPDGDTLAALSDLLAGTSEPKVRDEIAQLFEELSRGDAGSVPREINASG